MFRVRCLTSGSFIRIDSRAATFISFSTVKQLPKDIKEQMDIEAINKVMYTDTWVYLEFNTIDAATWFINRRLTYNEKRKDQDKLSFMRSIFEYNNLPDVTVKVEFDIVEFINGAPVAE